MVWEGGWRAGVVRWLCGWSNEPSRPGRSPQLRLSKEKSSEHGIPKSSWRFLQQAYPCSIPYHAFIYSTGKMQDLNQLIPAHSGWSLTTAYIINDAWPGRGLRYPTATRVSVARQG